MIKRAIAFFLLLCMLFTLCACSDEISGITIKDLEEKAYHEFAEGKALTVEKIDDGYRFSSEEEELIVGSMSISGTADSKKQITMITVYGEISVDRFLALDSAKEITDDLKDAGNVPMGKLAVESFLLNITCIAELCSGGTLDFELLLNAREGTQTKNGWSYSVTTDKNADTVTYTIVKEV